MIISIDKNAFFSDDNETLKSLTKIVELGIDENYLWDISNFDDFYEEMLETKWFRDFLSTNTQNEFIETLNKISQKDAYITELHSYYLNKIKIGFSENEINPIYAYRILKERSKLVLENSTNDWKFIKGITHKYTKKGDRRNLFKILDKAIENKLVEPQNAGGKDGIKPRITDLLDRHSQFIALKTGTVFDSDKKNEKDELSQTHRNLIEFLEKKSITWHKLEKREIENYLTPEIIEYYFPEQQLVCDELKQKSAEELDYLEYDKIFTDIDVKNEFPKLFLKEELKRGDLEKRCEHKKFQIHLPNGTLTDVSELEYLLIKLVKIF